ncbi:MAG: hypothetical protein IPI10_11565 [Bacteroidetes bacterium]|nr:hypothetical protein [Bacteroidota bacterium]
MKLLKTRLAMFGFATSTGLVKFDGEKFATYSTEVGLQKEEIFGFVLIKGLDLGK